MAGMGVMEGHTLSKGWEEFKGKFWEFMLVRSKKTLWECIRTKATSTQATLVFWFNLDAVI